MKKLKDLVLFSGKKKACIHTIDITVDDIRAIFFPKDFNEMYSYLGSIYTYGDGYISKRIRELVLAMDKKAKPALCPRWVLRFLNVFGNDSSIVRIRNYTLHRIHSRLTKGIRFIDWKIKWHDYDLRISISADDELLDLADRIEDEVLEYGKKLNKC